MCTRAVCDMFDVIAILELFDQAANQTLRTLWRGVHGHETEWTLTLLRHDGHGKSGN
jgi:hypothetical protein